MKNIEFQVVENLIVTGKTCNIERLIQGLIGEPMKNPIAEIRDHVRRGKKSKADELKRKLPAIIVSGTFVGGRKAEHLKEYSQVVCLDLDNVAGIRLIRAIGQVNKCPFTLLSFKSPSGNGLKVLVRVDSSSEYHVTAHKQVQDFYANLIGHKFDSTHDIARLTYMSYDEKPYYNANSEAFEVQLSELPTSKPVINYPEPPQTDHLKIYEIAKRVARRNHGDYQNGNRNKFVFLLARVANSYGLPKATLMHMLNWCDLSESELTVTVNNAYKNTDEFSTRRLGESLARVGDAWQKNISSKHRIEGESFESMRKILTQTTANESLDVHTNHADQQANNLKVAESGGTPFIPAGVKGRYPLFVRNFVNEYANPREQDVVFTAFISLLSGIMYNTVSVFRNGEIYPALGSVISAPSGSGKRVSVHVQKLFQPLHESLIKQGILRHGLFFADNTSTSALIRCLSDNDGRGILFSSDMGFFGHAMKKDISVLQGIFRTSLSDETVKNGRSSKYPSITVSQPRLAVCISSLPQEFHLLFNNPNDGMISRFLNYTFDPTGKWNELVEENLESHRKRQQEAQSEISSFFDYIQNRSFEFRLQAEQVDAINTWFEEQLAVSHTNKNHLATDAIVKRMQTHVQKLCMGLATMRAWEQKYEGSELTISMDDFDAIMKLGAVYLSHALFMVGTQVTITENAMNPEMVKFYEALPGSFKRKEAIEVVKTIGLNISERTIDNHLKRLVQLKLLNYSYNSYAKIKKDSLEIGKAA